jgi:ribulose 1,5-bisphosphate synthetase/thiazole synthase
MNEQKFDVIVAGGGTAGVLAGLSAAREGAKTLIVEKNRCLGGQFTSGMQGAWVGFSDKVKRCVGGMTWELRNILKEKNAIVDENPDTDVCYLYDTEVAKVVLDDMAQKEPNLTVYLNTQIADVIQEGDTVIGLTVLSEMQLKNIYGGIVIDCTGDAAVSAKAGAEFAIRDDRELQPMTLIGKMAGVDMEKVRDYYKKNPPIEDTMMPPAWHDFKTFPGLMHFGLKDELKNVTLPTDKEYLRHWLGIFTSTPNQGEMTINCSGALEADSTQGFETRTEQENFSQQCLYDVAWAMKNYIPGFENSYLTAIASMLGVRESRRVICDYEVTFDDFLNAKEFDDSIGRGAMPAGFHTPEGETMCVYDLEPGKSMTIPYRCMVVKGKENLLVAGRCVSYEIEVANCIRCMPQCMVMGEAAGTAAAIAIKEGVSVRDINVSSLKEKLLNRGGIL